MKSIWENSWFMIPALLFFNIGLALAYFVPYGLEIILLNPFRQEPLNSVFRVITLLGEAYPYFIAGIAALFWRYRFALLIALTGIVVQPSVLFFKSTFATDRPITYFRNNDLAEAVITVPGVDLNVGRTSFPSGHTMAAFGLYSILTKISGKKRRRLGLAFAVLAILVAVSRVFLVQHFLADILAGAALGMAASWLVWRINDTPLFRRMSFLEGSLLSRKMNSEAMANH